MVFHTKFDPFRPRKVITKIMIIPRVIQVGARSVVDGTAADGLACFATGQLWILLLLILCSTISYAFTLQYVPNAFYYFEMRLMF